MMKNGLPTLLRGVLTARPDQGCKHYREVSRLADAAFAGVAVTNE